MNRSEAHASTIRTLAAAASGDRSGVSALMEQVYGELRRLAAVYLQRERPGHTLQPTALVHEAFLRMVGDTGLGRLDRVHFFAIAATVMRRILVEHARGHGAQKRGGGAKKLTLHEALTPGTQDLDIAALDDALQELARMDERQARLVELRFFGGLSVDEAAEYLGVSKRTAEADWTLARAWLHRALFEEGEGSAGR